MDDLDEILSTGDDASIEAALEKMEFDDVDLFGDDQDRDDVVNTGKVEALAVEEPAEKEEPVKTEVNDEKPAVEPEPSPAEVKAGTLEKDGKIYVEVSSDNAVIESKNGKQSIPYDVLAGARERASKTAAELEEERQARIKLEEDLAEQKRINEMFTNQLKESGLDPKKTPEQILQDPEAMKTLAEENPQLGEIIQFLGNKVLSAKQEQPVEQPSNNNPVNQALEQTAELNSWRTNDPDRWELAVTIDDRLSEDPLFQNKSTAERFAEVERRVKLAFGDQVTESSETPPPAEASKKPVPAPIPNSPTDLGNQVSDLSANSQLLSKDAGELTAAMEGMTEAQIEDLLSEASELL